MNSESPDLPPAPTPALPDALDQNPAHSPVIPPNVTAAATLICFTLVCVLLYWGRTVAIPVALATLLSFMLNPLAKRLQRLRVPRGVASVFTVLLFCAAATTLTWIIGGQLSKPSQELPTYRQSIVQRVAEVRSAFQGGALEKLQTTMDNVAGDLGRSASQKPSFANPTQAVPVVISNSQALFDFEILGTLRPVLEPLSIAFLVLILSILMMICWDDLRSRLLSFSGKVNLTSATRALEDSGRKITRYLVAQALYNGRVGLAVGLGLAALRLPYVALWGHYRFYQRLLAHDELEVDNIAKEHNKVNGVPASINDAVIPALMIARKEDRHHLIPPENPIALPTAA